MIPPSHSPAGNSSAALPRWRAASTLVFAVRADYRTRRSGIWRREAGMSLVCSAKGNDFEAFWRRNHIAGERERFRRPPKKHVSRCSRERRPASPPAGGSHHRSLRGSGGGPGKPTPGPPGAAAVPKVPAPLQRDRRRWAAFLKDVSGEIQVFAAAPQNVAEHGFDPRTFGL